MAGARRFLADHKLAVSAVTVSLVVLGGVAAVATAPDPVTVTNIVDGDTIDVRFEGEELRVRLLNVDTPEVGECLADEATAFLEERLPLGTEVVLEYDVEEQDRYGRELAGVIEDGSLVNAEIARAGLGVAVVFEPNRHFYDDVLEAQEEAEAAGRGLFSADVDCTLPAQVRQYTEQAAALEWESGGESLERVDGWAAEAAAAAATGAALAEVLDGDRKAFPMVAYTGERWTLREDVDRATAQVTAAEEAIAAERTATEQRIEEAERREREEAERREREEREEREREEAERIERERQEAEQREREEAERREREQAAERQRQSSSSGSSSSGSSGSSGSSSSSGGAAPSDVYYKNCTAARNAGAAPVYIGEPGYARHLDRDGDGVGCE